MFFGMSYRTVEVEIDHGHLSPKGTEALPEKASGLLIILDPVPLSQPRPIGLAQGQFTVPDDFNAPLRKTFCRRLKANENSARHLRILWLVSGNAKLSPTVSAAVRDSAHPSGSGSTAFDDRRVSGHRVPRTARTGNEKMLSRHEFLRNMGSMIVFVSWITSSASVIALVDGSISELRILSAFRKFC